MAEYVLKLRLEDSDLYVATVSNSVATWPSREHAVKFALDNGIYHKVDVIGMWDQKDWYKKPANLVSLENLQED